MKSVSGQETGLSSEQKRSLLAELMVQSGQDVGLSPLSLAQQRLWFLEQLEPQTAAYHICAGLRLAGDLDLTALRCAVAAILARHETLRTAFITLDGEIFQKISPSADVDIPTVDLQALADTVREREAYDTACAEARRPFDL